MDLADGRHFDPRRRHFPEHLGHLLSVSLPGKPVDRACISLLIELMEVFLEQDEFRAWKLGILCALRWNSQSVMRQLRRLHGLEASHTHAPAFMCKYKPVWNEKLWFNPIILLPRCEISTSSKKKSSRGEPSACWDDRVLLLMTLPHLSSVL